MPSSRPELAPARFARFRVVRDLGFGAQGTVHEVVDVERNARLALKTLRSIGAEEIVRLKTEFRAVRDLQHPNLVRLGELIEEDGRWFFTMELVDGVDFLAHVRGEGSLEESTSWPTRVESGPRTRAAIGIDPETPALRPRQAQAHVRPRLAFDEGRLRLALAQLATGVAFLHAAGKVHCDVKPSNVLVDRHGRVVLIDFGVVSEFAAMDAGEQAMVGTVPYMAPEQVMGAPVGPAADWYATGVLLFEALTGRRPFEGEPPDVMARKCILDPPRPGELTPGLPPDLEALCVRMLAREPEQRPRDAEILRALGVAEGASDAAARPLFVGRDRELAALAAALGEVRGGGVDQRLPRGGVGRRKERSRAALRGGGAPRRCEGRRPGGAMPRAGAGPVQRLRRDPRRPRPLPPRAPRANARRAPAPRVRAPPARLSRAREARRGAGGDPPSLARRRVPRRA